MYGVDYINSVSIPDELSLIIIYQQAYRNDIKFVVSFYELNEHPVFAPTIFLINLINKSNENGIVDTGFDAAFAAEPLPQEDDHWNSILAQYDSLYTAVYDQLEGLQTALFIINLLSEFFKFIFLIGHRKFI